METPQQPAPQSELKEQVPQPHKKEKQPKKPSNYRISWPIVFILILLIAAGVGAWAYFGNVRLQGVASSRDEDLKHRQAEIVELNKDLDKARKELAELQTKNAAAATYITIPEWGVKFKPGADLKEFSYFIYSYGSTDSLFASTKSLLMAAYGANVVHQSESDANSKYSLCEPGSFGILIRGKAGEVITGTSIDKLPGAIKVGDYYYAIQGPQASCSADKTTADLQAKQNAAYKEVVKTLVPAN